MKDIKLKDKTFRLSISEKEILEKVKVIPSLLQEANLLGASALLK